MKYLNSRLSVTNRTFYPIFFKRYISLVLFAQKNAGQSSTGALTCIYNVQSSTTQLRHSLPYVYAISNSLLYKEDFAWMKKTNQMCIRDRLSPLPLRLQSVCLYRSDRPAARQAAAARWISPHCCSGRKIDLPKYDTCLLYTSFAFLVEWA